MRSKTILVLLSAAAIASAQPLPEVSNGLTIERLQQYPLIHGRSPSGPRMSPDGSRIVFGWNKTGMRKLDLWVMDYPSGERRMIAEADKIVEFPRQDDNRTQQQKDEAKLLDGGIGGNVTWAPDSSEFLFSARGKTFRTDRDGRSYEPVADMPGAGGNWGYSPDGAYYLYVDGQNLFRMHRKTGKVKQLTFLSKPGTAISGYKVSPDGKWIFIDWDDSSKMGSHVMMDFSRDRATVVNIQRMWQGEKSVDSQVGIVPFDGGIIRWVGDIPRYHWAAASAWSPDGSSLSYGWYREDFQAYTLSVIDPASLKKVDVVTEKAPSNFIPDWRPHFWSRDSKTIIYGTDIVDGKFAFRSVLSVSKDGTNRKPVYVEGHDVGWMGRPEKSDRILLVTAKRSPLKTEITIIEPDGKRTERNVMPDGFATPSGFDWAEAPLYSDDGTKIATMANNPTLNPELYAVEPKMRRLTESQLPEFQRVRWADVKEVTFQSPDGRTIHANLITKPGLDLSKKHPAVVSNIYGNSGKLTWGGYVENYMAMELDMVVLQVDFRASWGYGGEFDSGYYKKMGLVDADEAVAAKNFLASLPYVRGDRVGIWGWSYGGYLTCMTMLTKPGTYDTGVAVASVTDWKSYNEWYTRRRLGMVTEDPEIYKKTSPISYADGLKGNLLLVHGILDDNVLFQDTARLMQKMIEAGRYFDVMAYPRDDHSIGRDTSRPHVFATIVRYLYNKLYRP
ncbi:MAG: S9 family peptidase [Armatimonadetes bacterium]|nr:S9 family peptidase [Armatimonadota bacterium]